MAKSETFKFVGKCEYAMIFEDNRSMLGWNDATQAFDVPHPLGGRYSIGLIMDPADYKKFKMTGAYPALHSKYTEEGDDLVKLGRNHETRGRDGNVWKEVSGPVKVTHADGKPWDFEKDGAIGNGSTVEVEVTVYQTTKAPGTRLEAVKIIDLVEYAPEVSEDTVDEGVPF